MSKRKIVFITITLSIIIAATGGYFYIQQIISSGFNIEKVVYIDIDNDKKYDSVLTQISNTAKVKDLNNFKRLASILKYDENVKSGRYAITPDMSILEAIRLLKSGHQTPVRLTFNNTRTKDDLIKRLSEQLMLSDIELSSNLSNEVICEKYGFDTLTIGCMFIPNTYEVYWNTSAENLLNRMSSEYKRFWNATRIEKAKTLNLSPIEVAILASIVEEECYFSDEYTVVAGLYLNRLKKGMLLQADPTVKYAVGDFTLRRVLNKHLETDSPYNTYKHTGLPPGPIRLPSIKAIDAVLNHTNHNYLYMCAKEDFSGRHNFAVTHAEHHRNALKYQAALNKRKIY